MLDQLDAVARAAPAEGLPIEFGRLAELARLRAEEASESGAAKAQSESVIAIEAGALFDRLATDFGAGRIDPATVDRNWHITPARPDLVQLEQTALESGAVAATLTALLPTNPEYVALKAELARTLAEPPGAPHPTGFDREARLVKLRAALERWRWLPRVWPERRVEVHVPEFHLVLMQGDQVVTTHHVIVGKTVTSTPTFAATINGVILNPEWDPPMSILSGELAPRFGRHPDAPRKEGFQITDSEGDVLDPAAIDWKRRPLSVHVVQLPGPQNALGTMKFDMPNPYSIYLHDTPAKSLFGQAKRAFSHGCIRVEGIADLAPLVINLPEWDQQQIYDMIGTGFETEIILPTPLPVYVLYLTAARLDDGSITYVADLYKRDGPLIAALDAAQEAADQPASSSDVENGQ